MRTLEANIKVELTVDEYLYINKLIDRDRERPMVEYDLSDNKSMATCPVCGKPINKNLNFCGWCGQRYDNQTYEL